VRARTVLWAVPVALLVALVAMAQTHSGKQPVAPSDLWYKWATDHPHIVDRCQSLAA
jgi:hypothetical protein